MVVFYIVDSVERAMETTIWLSFDLGLKGDYEGMYAWLDAHHAEECGDSVAVLKWTSSAALLEELKADIKANVNLDNKARLYVIRMADKKMRGTFLFGNRKKAPWTGYAPSDANVDDSDA
jgi:hypothetical protein